MVVFAVLELLPGNAAQMILGESATPESLATLQAKLGLDRPHHAALRRMDRRPAAGPHRDEHLLRHAHRRR